MSLTLGHFVYGIMAVVAIIGVLLVPIIGSKPMIKSFNALFGACAFSMTVLHIAFYDLTGEFPAWVILAMVATIAYCLYCLVVYHFRNTHRQQPRSPAHS